MKAKYLLAAAAVALIAYPSAGLAQSTTKENAPGQQMQNPQTQPRQEGPGASGYAPGRQERTQDDKGASKWAPGQGGDTSKPADKDMTGSSGTGTGGRKR